MVFLNQFSNLNVFGNFPNAYGKNRIESIKVMYDFNSIFNILKPFEVNFIL